MTETTKNWIYKIVGFAAGIATMLLKIPEIPPEVINAVGMTIIFVAGLFHTAPGAAKKDVPIE